MSLTVAGYQMAVTKDIDANTSKLLAAIEQSAEAKADILLLRSSEDQPLCFG